MESSFEVLLIIDLINEINESIRRIKRRFEGIKCPEDFFIDDEGLDRLDGIAMMLISIGENVKRIDKVSQQSLLVRYPQVPWTGVMGVRDILAHDYFNIDAEEVFSICSRDIDTLQITIEDVKKDLSRERID